MIFYIRNFWVNCYRRNYAITVVAFCLGSLPSMPYPLHCRLSAESNSAPPTSSFQPGLDKTSTEPVQY